MSELFYFRIVSDSSQATSVFAQQEQVNALFPDTLPRAALWAEPLIPAIAPAPPAILGPVLRGEGIESRQRFTTWCPSSSSR